MHKVLVQTELQRLRQLGYEVFNPPYLSNIQDQSASLEWSLESQDSSLPSLILQELSSYNFFYNPISEKIAEILNKYFDAIIVTINPSWLLEVCKVYNGKIIYRTYGSPYCISEELTNIGADIKILERDNFWYVPHAQETLQYEHKWLQERVKIIPYCITDDVIKKENTWKYGVSQKKPEIALTCPNIDNEYYKNHYKFLKKEFGSPHFRLYGVQLNKVNDFQVVGSLTRNDQLEALRNSSGYLYTYDEPCVCYLPPIEMATMGGPVLFLRGSLLDRFFPQDAAARCFSIQDAHDKCNRLLHGDMTFRNQIIKESRDVVRRYHPKYVWPVFDKKIKEAIFQNNKHATWLSSYSKMRKTNKQAKSFYILNHFPGRLINFKKGEYSSAEGIPRVLRKMVLALSRQQKTTNFYITCGPNDIAFTHGYFIGDTLQRNINILPLAKKKKWMSHFRAEWKRLWNKAILLIPPNLFHNANNVRKQLKNYAMPKLGLNKKNFPFNKEIAHLLIKKINADPACQAVLIPHYYLFPEAILLKKKSILYLPDYLPWLFPKNKEFIEIRSKYESIGKSISKRAAAIMTNSNFTKKYLSNCPLKIEKNKIHVVPLPLLMNSTPRSSHNMTLVLPEKFIFYPTQQRPNKQIGDLLKVFSILRKSYKNLFLVLTSDPAKNEDVKVDFLKCADRKNIVILPRISDYELSMTYRKAKVLAFTSSAEGNFPPQIFEAIAFDTPVVAFRHEFIYEAIPPALESCLMLAEPGNIQDFVDKVIYAIKNSKAVAQKQKRLLKLLSEANSFKSLSCSIGKVLEKIQGINSLKY